MDKKCYVCGYPATDMHHVFNGAMRKKSEEYGAVIPVCRKCHYEIHSDKPYYDEEDSLKISLKKEFQHRIMVEHNISINEWLEIFHKNYLEVEND